MAKRHFLKFLCLLHSNKIGFWFFLPANEILLAHTFSQKHRPIKDEAPTSQDARAKGEREKTTAIYDASKVLDGAPIKKDQ